MINSEPVLKVGILERAEKISGKLSGIFNADGSKVTGEFVAQNINGSVEVTFSNSDSVCQKSELMFIGSNNNCSFLINDVIIGIKFHWQRNETHHFRGDLILSADKDNTITVINQVKLEDYLQSVISSEMSATAPVELLKAHAITSRSWLAAMLNRKGKEVAETSHEKRVNGTDEFIRWYGREEHLLFDVCADDHCQRYHGISRIIADSAKTAVNETRGTFLVSEGSVCDARYSKSCGGITEEFPAAWEDTDVPYLKTRSDAETDYPSIRNEDDAGKWIHSNPEAYCNTNDAEILKTILPGFDQETADFFRWEVKYSREELEKIILEKSGIDFGSLKSIESVERGPSGRVVKLKIEGTKKSIVIGKELEIRRWLAPSHLYSSAFTVETIIKDNELPESFILQGAGWGHGIGLCQIGAAVMAIKGKTAPEILNHYFVGAEILKLY